VKQERVEDSKIDVLLQYMVPFFLFLFAFIIAFNKINEPDTFWHLEMGRYILTTHTFPYHNIFSYTLTNIKFYPVEWFFEVVWYFIYSLSGFTGLIVLKATISGLTALLLLLSFKNHRINKYLSFIIISSVFITAGSYFLDRPQLITYLGISLFVFITSLPEKNKSRVLWLIPVVMLVWVNMHPGAIFGIVFLLAWLMDGFVKLLTHNIEVSAFYRRLTILFVTLLITFLTPNTYHLYSFLFLHLTSFGPKGGLNYIAEFMPPSFSQTPAMFVGLIVFTVIFLIGIFKMPLRYVFFGLVMIPMSFDMRRMVIMALIGIAPGVGIVLNDWFTRLIGLNKAHAIVSAMCALIVIMPFFYVYYQYKTDYVGYKGIGVSQQSYPEQAIDFILDHRIKGNIYNSMNFGGAVIFLGYPYIKDFIDTRLEPERLLLPEVINSINNAALFDVLLSKYKVTYALVETYVPVNYSELLPPQNWYLVYFDDYAQVYVKRDTGNDQIIKQYAYRVFNPYTFLYTITPFLSPEAYFTQDGLLEDVKELVKRVPYSAMANLAYGLTLIYNNFNYEEGLRYIDIAKHIMPYNPRVTLWYGIEHGLNGNTKLMESSFDMVNTLLKYQEGVTNRDKAYMNFIMGYYYYVTGLNFKAIKNLVIALKYDPHFKAAQSLLELVNSRRMFQK